MAEAATGTIHVLIWGFDPLPAMVIEDELVESLAPLGTIARTARAKADVPTGFAGFVDFARRHDVIVLPLTLPRWSSLLLPHVLHRIASPTRTLLKTAGNSAHAVPLFDMLYPPTAAAVRSAPRRIGDDAVLLDLERNVFMSNNCFRGAVEDAHPGDPDAETRWCRYLRARNAL